MELRAGADSREQLWVEPTTAAPKAKVATERVSRSNNKMVSTFKWISWLPDFLRILKKVDYYATGCERVAVGTCVGCRHEGRTNVQSSSRLLHDARALTR